MNKTKEWNINAGPLLNVWNVYSLAPMILANTSDPHQSKAINRMPEIAEAVFSKNEVPSTLNTPIFFLHYCSSSSQS